MKPVPALLLVLLVLLPVWGALAAPADKLGLAMDIARELRCPMATNQSLFESENAIASELKAQIYLMVEQGQTREQIIDFMSQRYGEQIRFQPRFGLSTMLLWGAPLLLFLSLALLAFRPAAPRSLPSGLSKHNKEN